jgi:hypothetical protein
MTGVRVRGAGGAKTGRHKVTPTAGNVEHASHAPGSKGPDRAEMTGAST